MSSVSLWLILLLDLSGILQPLLILRRLLPAFASGAGADQVHVGAQVRAVIARHFIAGSGGSGKRHTYTTPTSLAATANRPSGEKPMPQRVPSHAKFASSLPPGNSTRRIVGSFATV